MDRREWRSALHSECGRQREPRAVLTGLMLNAWASRNRRRDPCAPKIKITFRPAVNVEIQLHDLVVVDPSSLQCRYNSNITPIDPRSMVVIGRFIGEILQMHIISILAPFTLASSSRRKGDMIQR
jgi:hypothetical protein